MGTSDRFAPGSRIGDYVVERASGDGYEAVHVLLPRRVRLEVMHPTFVGLKPVAVRMMREACILEALRHPGVPRIFEVGMMNDQRTTRPWVASELVEGESIASVGVLSPTEVLEMLRDVAEVLAHVHQRGIVHRALRAESVVRSQTRGYPVCLVDWSDARVDASDCARADDVFELGVIAYQALTDHLPDMATARRAPYAPTRLCLMIDDLLVANPMCRPSAAEVRARAKLILETMNDGEPPVLEELIDLDAATELSCEEIVHEPSVPPLPALRTRWTPPLGVTASSPAAPATRSHAGISIGILKPRS